MPPPTMMTSWRESVMSDDDTATLHLKLCASSLLIYDQRDGRERLMDQRTRGASHGNRVGSRLCALALAATTTSSTATAIASSSTARNQRQRQQTQSEQRSWQCELGVLSAASSCA